MDSGCRLRSRYLENHPGSNSFRRFKDKKIPKRGRKHYDSFEVSTLNLNLVHPRTSRYTNMGSTVWMRGSDRSCRLLGHRREMKLAIVMVWNHAQLFLLRYGPWCVVHSRSVNTRVGLTLVSLGINDDDWVCRGSCFGSILAEFCFGRKKSALVCKAGCTSPFQPRFEIEPKRILDVPETTGRYE